ncbi:hypothetical protein EVAR_997_1 [Eumeta japonica]|uniref:Uncharacterized protein n=1 Tax=Eumeta variegata TaxID=151549 RepID=A0A4C1SEZ9_EUMVA|nr:hypothetical protein EVAR_997_1 [Eumeta japonica]
MLIHHPNPPQRCHEGRMLLTIIYTRVVTTSEADGLIYYPREKANGLMYDINKWHDDGEEENATEAGEHNENEASINTGTLAVTNTRFSLSTQKA